MTADSDAGKTIHDEFDAIIAAYSDATDPDDRERIRQSLWDRFGRNGTTFISDMANFTSTSRTLGVCHFLKMIYRARSIVAPIIAANDGVLLKCDADNCYAFFDEPQNAIHASFDINAALFRNNQEHDIDEHIYLSVGIDHGELLLVGDEDFYGDPVNTASKLGEDLAIKGETLVTERALARATVELSERVERMVARVADIEISYVRIPMTATVSAD